MPTASATTHSGSNRDFLVLGNWPRISGVLQRVFVSAMAFSNHRSLFGLLVSGLKIPFPGKGERGS
jgi:hypothetical protein